MPSSDEPLEIYVDRSLGQIIVPGALRELALVVRTEIEVFGDVSGGVPDPVWLERAGREGWVIFTKDAKIRYRAAEIGVLAATRVKAFVLSGGNLSAAEQARRLVRNISHIRAARAATRVRSSTPSVRMASSASGRGSSDDLQGRLLSSRPEWTLDSSIRGVSRRKSFDEARSGSRSSDTP